MSPIFNFRIIWPFRFDIDDFRPLGILSFARLDTSVPCVLCCLFPLSQYCPSRSHLSPRINLTLSPGGSLCSSAALQCLPLSLSFFCCLLCLPQCAKYPVCLFLSPNVSIVPLLSQRSPRVSPFFRPFLAHRVYFLLRCWPLLFFLHRVTLSRTLGPLRMRIYKRCITGVCTCDDIPNVSVCELYVTSYLNVGRLQEMDSCRARAPLLASLTSLPAHQLASGKV
jgi:hypothetical protein